MFTGLRADGTRPTDPAQEISNQKQEDDNDPWLKMMRQATAISGLPIGQTPGGAPKPPERKTQIGIFANKAPRSLMCFTLENGFRRSCIRLADSHTFENFILITIFANCAALGFYTPLPDKDDSSIQESLDSVDRIFLAIFTMECIIRIIANGFLFHPNAYHC